MSRSTNYKLSFLVIAIFLNGCATYNLQYDKYNDDFKAINVEQNFEIAHTFYLIGDAGNAELGKDLGHFNLLKEELSTTEKNSTILFLGDNLYEKGMPKKNHPTRKLSEHRLDAQINLIKDYKGKPIFIPGNHDYYSNGVRGLEREASYITEKLIDKDAFLPKNGCPLKKVDISDDIVLIIVDSQWYLEDWDDNPTMNDECEIKSREKFFEEFESLIKKNETKTTLIAMHHPMFSNGSHAGQYSMRAQFYPMNNKIPLPLIGTLANILRKTSGISTQDMNNSLYLEMKKRIVTLSQKSEKVIFISGHEHNLQYLFIDNKPQIISGSGSKTSPARVLKGSKFSYGGLGYAKLIVYKNGASWVSYFTEYEGEKKIVIPH